MNEDKNPKIMTLRTLRESKELSLAEVASRVGVSKSIVSLWELGQRVPAADKFFRLAKIYEVNAEYLATIAGYITGGESDK